LQICDGEIVLGDADFDGPFDALRARDGRKAQREVADRAADALRGAEGEAGGAMKRPAAAALKRGARSPAGGAMKRPAAAAVPKVLAMKAAAKPDAPGRGGSIRLERTRSQFVARRNEPGADGRKNKVFKYSSKAGIAAARKAAEKWSTA
jgi:hypothetical protein